ncbi:TonB-dependent siderophore receptor [Horticoccus sp. 23ND18S-11]|uniref:TonB-dependent siderophore receptor n=1 Tax=Horticoccus sp. 23ND18S-11 TaxID=3391832 RepID=UPI0039C9B04E
MNHVRIRFHLPRALTTALLFGVTALSAQTPAKQAATAAPLPDETIMLSPYEVNTAGDVGYTAASALAGGRTDTPLKLTSAAISVMTSQFLDDIGSTNFRTAGEWSLNWVPQLDVNTGVAGGFTINYRNMGSTFASRNYFLWYVESDSYNTERYEFARGPNGVLFGDGGPGGISTTWTKRPRFDRATNVVNFRLDSYGGWRSSVDVNRPVTKSLSLRLNAFAENAPGYRDHNHNERQGVHLAGIYRLTRKNQFRFEGEFGLQDRSIYPSYYIDQASHWNRATANNGVTVPSTTGTGIARISTNNFFVLTPGVAGNALLDWGPSYQTIGTGFGLLQNGEARTDIPNSPRLPSKEFNLQPPDSVARLYYYAYTVYLDHRFTDNLFAEVAFNRFRNDRHSHGSQSLFNTYRIDVNQLLPNGAINPNFGKPFTDTERVKTLQGNIVSDVRALLNWRFETTWLKQSFSGIFGSRLDRFDSWSRTLRRVNGTNPNLTVAANQVRERRYWDQTALELGEIPVFPGVALDYIPTAISHQRKTLDYAQIASTSRFFNDRLALMLGARRDAVKNVQQTNTGIPVDPVTGLPRLGAVIINSAGAPVAIIGEKSRGNFAPVSRNAGGVWFVLPWLGVFANTSETFAAPNSGNNLIDGTTPPISKSRGKDFGFKFELLSGRIAATASYYTSEQKGLLIAGANTTELNRIGTNLNRPELATLAFRDTQDQKGDGYEFEVTANPVRALRITANLALPKTSAVNLQPGLVGYFNDNVASWTAAGPTSLNPTQVANDINTIRNALASITPGTVLNNTFKYTGNLYATYSFTEGLLKNVAFGAGGNFRGRAKVASVTGNAYDYLYANAYTVIAAHATYRHRIFGKYNLRYQLNVANVLDNDKAIYNGFGTYRVANIGTNPLLQAPNNIRMSEPRKFTLQATLDF